MLTESDSDEILSFSALTCISASSRRMYTD